MSEGGQWLGAQRAAEGLRVHSVNTGGYCKARQRLPTQMVVALMRATGCLLSAQAHRQWRWRGRAVKLVDGTGISMPDTLANQVRYPQPSSQAKGVGFPIARAVGVICLSTGAVLDAAVGPLEGRGHSELDLFRGLLGAFCPGDVMLADALYCNYFLIATLQSCGVDVVFEQNGSCTSGPGVGHHLARCAQGAKGRTVAAVRPALARGV